MTNNNRPLIPRGLRLVNMNDTVSGSKYLLAFSEDNSEYEDLIGRLGGPDDNAMLLNTLLSGTGMLVDVGANIGTVCVPVSARGSSVVAMEMIPANCLKLWTCRIFNELKDFQVVQAAASDYDGILTFSGTEAWGSVGPRGSGTPALCFRLDTILSEVHPVREPLVFKIDVEGHEASVLRGARNTIGRYRPVILFESIDIEGMQGSAGRETKQVMHAMGYELFMRRKNVLYPKSASDVQEEHVADFVGVPRERLDVLSSLQHMIRPLADQERVSWIREMAEHWHSHHRMHAGRVMLRWATEQPHLFEKCSPFASSLMKLDQSADLEAELRKSFG